jgi:predicted DNA binding CopG/RHH family protein
LEPVTGGKARQFMRAKIKYTDEPIEAKVIQDFLPPPEELAFREEGVKVTIALSKKSVEFFKSEATKHHTQYQRMIRRLIDAYVDTYEKPLTSRATRTARKRASG